jgi:hypothetical protein
MKICILLLNLVTIVLGDLPKFPQNSRVKPSASSPNEDHSNEQQPFRTSSDNRQLLHSDHFQFNTKNSQNSDSFSRPNLKSTPSNPLIRSIGSASVSLIYLFLAWRSVACYEQANLFINGFTRKLSSNAVILLFISNLTGFLISLFQPHKYKSLLKSIIALNTVREFTELIYNMFMIIVASPTADFSRDFYLGRFITCVYLLMVCLSTSKLRWVNQQPIP